MSSERERKHGDGHRPPGQPEKRGDYWERFRRQQVDDPVDERGREREGYWERFRRQQVDDPVDKRR